MVKLLIVGSLNMDMVADVDHTPLTGETILTRETTLIPGGKGANQAYAAGKLKADVTMLGAVGGGRRLWEYSSGEFDKGRRAC